MRVLNVYRTYFPDPPGGLQEAIRQICLSTNALGISNSIFTLSPSPIPTLVLRPEAKVFRSRSWAAPASCDLGGFDSFIEFRRLAKDADLIHYFFPWPFADLLREVAPKKPMVITYISDIVRQQYLGKLYAPLMYRHLNAADAIVVNAPGYAQTSAVLQDSALNPKLRQIPLGIDEKSYEAQTDDSIFQTLGFSKDEKFALFIGVLRYYKGLDSLLQAAKNVQERIIIAGSGPEEIKLKALVRELKLSNVVFAGQVSDQQKLSLLKACSLFILPSHLRSEAYGMVLVEASMFSKPMISCEIGTGTSYINQHNETGLVVEPNNPNALACAMNELMNSESTRATFGRAARQRYENLFSASAKGKAYAELFNEVLG